VELLDLRVDFWFGKFVEGKNNFSWQVEGIDLGP